MRFVYIVHSKNPDIQQYFEYEGHARDAFDDQKDKHDSIQVDEYKFSGLSIIFNQTLCHKGKPYPDWDARLNPLTSNQEENKMIILTDEQRKILGTLSILDRFEEGEFAVLNQKIYDAHKFIAPQFTVRDRYEVKTIYLYFEEYKPLSILDILHYNPGQKRSEALSNQLGFINESIEKFTYFSGYFSNEQIKEQYDKIVKPIILYAAEKLKLVFDIKHEKARETEPTFLMENYDSLIRKLYEAVQWAEDHDSPIDGINREFVDKHRDVLDLVTKVNSLKIFV